VPIAPLRETAIDAQNNHSFFMIILCLKKERNDYLE